MIISIFFYILSILLSLVNSVAFLSFEIPYYILQPFYITIDILLMFDSIVPVKTTLTIIVLIMSFEIIVLTSGFILSIFNWIRGAGELKIPIQPNQEKLIDLRR
jgi:hypothetical protein